MNIRQLIESIRHTVNVEVREFNEDIPFMDCVVKKNELDHIVGIITGSFGAPMKDFGEPVNFDRNVQGIINRFGGIRKDQCLFFKEETGNTYFFAMLWPWHIDSGLVTVKIGSCRS